MNKSRRKQISDLSTEVSGIITTIEDASTERNWEDIKARIDEAHAVAESIRDDEQEYYDNMIPSFQSGDKGEAAQSAITCLEEAAMKLEGATTAADDEKPDADDICEHLREATEQLDEAEGY